MIFSGRLALSVLLTYALSVILHTSIWVLTEQHLFAFLLSALDLAIHETGHMLFLLPKVFIANNELAHFVYVAGGSLLQWLLPVAIASYFFTRRQFFAAAVVLFWVGYPARLELLAASHGNPVPK